MEVAAIRLEFDTEIEPFLALRPVAAVLECESEQMRRGGVARLARQDRAADSDALQGLALTQQRRGPLDLLLHAHPGFSFPSFALLTRKLGTSLGATCPLWRGPILL